MIRKISILLLFLLISNGFVKQVLAGPTSSTYEIKDYTFGGGGTGESGIDSSNFTLFGTAGEIDASKLNGGSNYSIGGGLTYTLQASVSAAPTFTNTGSNYDRLKFTLNSAIGAADTQYAIAISTGGGGSTAVNDTFTESGSGLADLSTHTAETGGTWSYLRGTNNKWNVDKTNDRADSTGASSDSYYYLPSSSLGDGDITSDSFNTAGQLGIIFRVKDSNNFYFIDAQLSTNDVSLKRMTAGSVSTVASEGSPSLHDHIRIKLSGSSPTHIQFRTWTGTEPSTWDIDTTDNTSGNQIASGSIGLYGGNNFPAGRGGTIDNLTATSTDSTTTSYVQSDNTLGSNLVWQTYPQWGGSSGAFVTGLANNSTYYIKVKARQGNFTEGPWSIASSATTSDPSLTFSLDSSTINFSNLNSGNSYTDSAKTSVLTTSTNAYNGYVVYGKESQTLTSSVGTIPDFPGTNSSPTTWSGTGFGYNTSDTNLQTGSGGSSRFSGSKYAGFPISSSTNGDPVADNLGPVQSSPISGEQFTVSYRVTGNSTTPAGTYTNTIQYTIVPTY